MFYRPKLMLSILGVSWAVLAGAQAPPQAVASPAAPVTREERFFEQQSRWQVGWGTDATVTLSGIDKGSTNAPNDGSTPFDAYWARLYGHLRYGDTFELVADVFSADGRQRPRVFGLYARVQPSSHLGLRIGRIPLVVGAWQDRAYPSRQALIGAPLLAQYLLPLRTSSIPGSVDELLNQSGRGPSARFARQASGGGGSVTLFYEHCWDTGVEAFGRFGRLRYRVALTENAPGAAAELGEQKNGVTTQGRLTWQSDAWRLGASWARGAYLSKAVNQFLPAGSRVGDYRQHLVGTDARFKHGRLELNLELARNEYDSPNVDARLRTNAGAADVAFEAWPGVTLAARVSALRSTDVTDSRGRRQPWDAGVTRVETGATYRFLGDHVALKGVYQHTRVSQPVNRNEDVVALQLALHK